MAKALSITLGAPYFQVLCDGLLLYGKTMLYLCYVLHNISSFVNANERHLQANAREQEVV